MPRSRSSSRRCHARHFGIKKIQFGRNDFWVKCGVATKGIRNGGHPYYSGFVPASEFAKKFAVRKDSVLGVETTQPFQFGGEGKRGLMTHVASAAQPIFRHNIPNPAPGSYGDERAGGPRATHLPASHGELLNRMGVQEKVTRIQEQNPFVVFR